MRMAERGRPRSFDRNEALRRAMMVFWERGYDGASMADLTAAMGINSPSLYAAFGCKEALFREAVELYVATDGSATVRALSEQPTARAAVDAMLRRNAETFAVLEPPRGCLVVLGVGHATPDNKSVNDHLAARRRQVQEQIAKRLERGVADGDLPRGIDIVALAAFYSTVLQGISIQARDGASREALIAVVDCAMAAWDRLAVPKTPAAEPHLPPRAPD
jgi:AcrR family transcriptional regulator